LLLRIGKGQEEKTKRVVKDRKDKRRKTARKTEASRKMKRKDLEKETREDK
jgi:hypothetical protein